MANKLRAMGTGAVISALANVVHPSNHIRDEFSNLPDEQRLKGDFIICIETKTLNCQDQEAMMFCRLRECQVSCILKVLQKDGRRSFY